MDRHQDGLWDWRCAALCSSRPESNHQDLGDTVDHNEVLVVKNGETCFVRSDLHGAVKPQRPSTILEAWRETRVKGNVIVKVRCCDVIPSGSDASRDIKRVPGQFDLEASIGNGQTCLDCIGVDNQRTFHRKTIESDVGVGDGWIDALLLASGSVNGVVQPPRRPGIG